jgi:hypothetical protein
VQNGGVVRISGGSIEFKGGSIARSTAVRDRHRRQLGVSHGVAWGALHLGWCILQRVLRTAHICLMLHVVRICCILLLHVVGCRLHYTCLSRPVG